MVTTIGPGLWPYEDGTAIPFGPNGQQALATIGNRISGSGIGYCPALSDVTALVTNAFAYAGLHVYCLATDTVYKFTSTTAYVPIMSAVAPVCRLTKTAGQSTSGTINTNTGMVWDVETFDIGGMHDTVTNNTRATVPTNWGGIYQAMATARFSTSSAQCTIQFAVNGTVRGETSNMNVGTAVGSVFTQTASLLQLNAGDYVEVFMQANSATIGLIAGNCTFSLQWEHS